VVAAVLLTAVGFPITLFSAISACPVNLAGGLLLVGATRPLLDASHVHVEQHRSRRARRLLHHQPGWYVMAAVMLAAGSFLSASTA
jgi:hypothetical protein